MRFGLLLAMSMMAGHAWAAQESSNSLSVGDVLRPKTFEEDKRINDLELRAQAGSLSRYSLKFNLGYSGPPINQLADPNRPNPDNRPGDQRTNLAGSMAARYRLSSNQAVNVGTGMRWFTPYQAIKGEEVDRPKGTKNYDINDPYVAFDQTYVVGDAQMRTSGRFAKTTADYFTARGQWGTFGVDQAVKYTPFQSHFILGLQFSGDVFAYGRPYQPAVSKKDPGDGANISKYYLTFIPSVEYKLSSAVNFNTSLGYSYQNVRADNSYWRWNHPLTTWRVGFGWAIDRDIYINPYVNFFAEKPTFDTASLSFNTVFSIF